MLCFTFASVFFFLTILYGLPYLFSLLREEPWLLTFFSRVILAQAKEEEGRGEEGRRKRKEEGRGESGEGGGGRGREEKKGKKGGRRGRRGRRRRGGRGRRRGRGKRRGREGGGGEEGGELLLTKPRREARWQRAGRQEPQERLQRWEQVPSQRVRPRGSCRVRPGKWAPLRGGLRSALLPSSSSCGAARLRGAFQFGTVDDRGTCARGGPCRAPETPPPLGDPRSQEGRLSGRSFSRRHVFGGFYSLCCLKGEVSDEAGSRSRSLT